MVGRTSRGHDLVVGDALGEGRSYVGYPSHLRVPVAAWLRQWGAAHTVVGDDGGLALGAGWGAGGPVTVTGQTGAAGDCVVHGVVRRVGQCALPFLRMLIQYYIRQRV